MGPPYRPRRFQDTIKFYSLLFTVPISLSQSSSPLLREEITKFLQKRAVESVPEQKEKGPFPIIFDGVSSFSIRLSLTKIQVISISFKRNR